MDKVDHPLPDLADPEKTRDPSTSSFDLTDKDEALRLVGLERTESFTKEEYLAVRRKLVRFKGDGIHFQRLDDPSLGLDHSAVVPSRVLLPIPVRSSSFHVRNGIPKVPQRQECT